MEIKRDTIMTSYFKEMTLGFFIITIDVKTTVLLSIIYLFSLPVKPDQFDLIQWKRVKKFVKLQGY